MALVLLKRLRAYVICNIYVFNFIYNNALNIYLMMVTFKLTTIDLYKITLLFVVGKMLSNSYNGYFT